MLFISYALLRLPMVTASFRRTRPCPGMLHLSFDVFLIGDFELLDFLECHSSIPPLIRVTIGWFVCWFSLSYEHLRHF